MSARGRGARGLGKGGARRLLKKKEMQPWDRKDSWIERLWSSLGAYRSWDRYNADALREALENGAPVNSPDPSGIYATPLHAAAATGNMELVDLLVDVGARVDVKDTTGRFPQDVASEKGHKDVAARLRGLASAVSASPKATRAVPHATASPQLVLALPLDWRRMKEEEDGYRNLFVADRSHADLENPRLLLIDVFSTKLRLRAPPPVTLLFEGTHKNFRPSDACVVSEDIYREHWRHFSQDLFAEEFPWDNVLCAGGAPLACLLPLPERFEGNPARTATYYREESAFRGSDIDLFIYGLDPERATQKVGQRSE